MLDPYSEVDFGDQRSQLVKGVSEVELVSGRANVNKTSVYFDYSVVSSIDIKRIVKFLPTDTIFSFHDKVSGIYGDYLPNTKAVVEVHEGSAY